LERHLLAFADHGAEFYAGSGGDLRRALELARVNADNRPTLRALEHAYIIAISADDAAAAFEFLSAATGGGSAIPQRHCQHLLKSRERGGARTSTARQSPRGQG